MYDSTVKNIQNKQLYSQKEDYDYLRLEEKKPEWVLGFFMEPMIRLYSWLECFKREN